MHDELKLNRIDYVILTILSQSTANDEINAMTIKEIMEASEGCLKRTTTHKFLHHLIEHELVQVSGKADKARTYFITTSGEDILKGGR